MTTHVSVKGDSYLQSDAVFGVKNSLITDFVKREGTARDGTKSNMPFWEAHYDFVLATAK